MSQECQVEVIGCGWGRTGNTSFQNAIEILGLGPCYHMNENFGKGHAELWTKFADQGIDIDIHDILGKKGYRSTCDFPAAVYWHEQMLKYPNAKVILLQRDPIKWYNSFMATIANMQPDNPLCPYGVRVAFAMGLPCKGAAEMLHKVITRDCFDNNWNKENIIQSYINYCNEVKRLCPLSKLLVYNVSQGWEPLCKFLNLPIPIKDFPHANTQLEYQQFVGKVNGLGLGVSFMGLGFPLLLQQNSLINRFEKRHREIMQAVVYHKHSMGESNYANVTIQEIRKPVVRSGFAVVKVYSAAINPLDYKVFKGYTARAGWYIPSPFIPGYDFAGVIESLEDYGLSGLLGFKEGDEVFGMNFGLNRHDEPGCTIAGSFAEYILVPITKLSRKGTNVSFDQAAGLSFVGVTAYQCLFDCASLSKGQKILIIGGSSAVGSLAIQLAKLRGAWVVTTCSTHSIAYVSQFQPDQIIDYTVDKWDEELYDIDVVFDAVGEVDAFARVQAAQIVKQNGVFISIASFDAGLDPIAHSRFCWAAKYGVSRNRYEQDELMTLVTNGELNVPIDQTFPFTTDGIQAMFAKIEAGKSHGKNVLRIVSNHAAAGAVTCTNEISQETEIGLNGSAKRKLSTSN